METRTDIELIAAFAASGDEPFDRAQGEAAFAELVNRHQQMVFRTCLRMLNDAHEAQDATQATFIVLMKKADRLKREGALGGWLHAVARRVSLEAIQRRAAEVKRREAANAAAESNDAEATVDTDAVLHCVDEELERLSAPQRQAVVLRYLQGLSQEQSSILAGCPLGTMKRRASDGIARLRSRLAKRGIAIGLPALTAALASEAQAAIPETLLPSTMTAIKAYAAGAATTTAVSANVVVLTKGVLNMLFWSSVKTAVVATAACIVVAGTSAVVAQKAMEPAMTNKAVMEKATPAMCELTVSLDTGDDRTGGFSVNSAYRPVRVVAIHSQPPLMTLATGEVITAWTLRSETFGLIAKPARVKFVVRTTKIKNDRPQYWIKEVDGRLVPELVHLSAADNGQTIRTTVGSLVVIGLKNERQGAGWEPAPKEIDGESVALRTPNRTRNCDGFDWVYAHAFKPPDATVSNTVGTYVYEYTCIRVGKSTIHLSQIVPGGPIPQARWASAKLGDFSVSVDVVDGNSDSSALEQKLKSIVIPGWSITEEPLAKAVAKLVDAISTNDPQHARVAIELDPPTPSLRLQLFTLLTMDSRGSALTAMRILETMAQMSGQKVTFEKNRVVLSPLRPDKTTVVITEMSFKDTPVAEVVKTLQTLTGVPIKLYRTDNLPLITLSAKNIQLDNAVLSIAGKTGLAMGYEKDGLVLK